MSDGGKDGIDLLVNTILNGESASLKDKRHEEGDPKQKQFAILSFLQNEEKRVSKIQNLFSKQFNMIKEYPQSETLLKEQNDYQDELMILLLDKLRSEETTFFSKISRSWDSQFNVQLK